MRTALPAVLSCALLLGCSGLPDQQLAREALLRGDSDTARQNFQALARRGYAEARVALGDMDADSRDPRRLAEAESLYRQAAPASLKAQARLGRLLVRQDSADDARLKEAEGLLTQAVARGEYSAVVPLTLLYLSYPRLSPPRRLQQRVDGWRAQGIAEAELAQILIYRSEGSYAAHLEQIAQACRTLLYRQDVCYVELATVNRLRQQPQAALLRDLRAAYARRQVAASRVESVALVLADPDIPAPAEPEQAKSLLEEIAPVYSGAWASLARLLYDYPALGGGEALLGYLERGRAVADSRAELLTGRLYYEGRELPQDPRQAEAHLLKAAAEQPEAHYYLGQIYRRGYLGAVQPQPAVDHLLRAARAGHGAADLALAQLFSEARGVRVDRVSAYVFARLASGQAQPEAASVLAALEPGMTPAERQQALQILGEEQGTRRWTPLRLARVQPQRNGMELP